MEDLKRNISARVRALRVREGLTQFEFAERTGLSIDTVSAIERRKAVPDVVSLCKICRALDIPLRTMLEEDAPIDGGKRAAIDRVMALLKRASRREILLAYDILKKVVDSRRRGNT